MPLWEFKSQGQAWQEIYRTVVVGERKAAKEIRAREERRARMQQMLNKGKGRR